MGAYQDIMGDVHNLFGRVNEVHVFEDAEEPGGYYIEETIHGHTV
jgi:arginine decarboxylase